MTPSHKSGFVAVIGKPNAGKSTLMNAMVGDKLSIVTPKAQTTRHRILGIANAPEYQIVFSDTPGVIKPRYGLHKSMMKSVNSAMDDADLILFIVDVNEKFPETDVLEMLNRSKIPVILAVNKIDDATEEDILRRLGELRTALNPIAGYGISALMKIQLDELRQCILDNLPEGPAYYDKDAITDRPERFFVTEIIREKLFLNLEEEIPYSCEVTILTYEEKEEEVSISAEIHVERKSQKGMVIGKQGTMISKIRKQAKSAIKHFLGRKVNLELYVRVAEEWKDNDMRLKGFGY
jgi:GTPase